MRGCRRGSATGSWQAGDLGLAHRCFAQLPAQITAVAAFDAREPATLARDPGRHLGLELRDALTSHARRIDRVAEPRPVQRPATDPAVLDEPGVRGEYRHFPMK